MQFKVIYILSLFTLVIVSCNAPRTNPLDPENPDNRIYNINGVVREDGFPNLPIDSVTVVWENSGKFVFTDIHGKFNIQEISATDGVISFEKEGFSFFDTLIVWNDKKNYEIETILNKAPVLDSLEFFSIVENKSQFSEPKYTLNIRARISDEDGEKDIVSVWITNEELNFERSLFENSSTGFYERSIKVSDLGILSLQEIIGKKFSIHVTSLKNGSFIVGRTNLTRVISEVLQTIAPQNSQQVFEHPFDLEWNRFTPGYNFTYYVQIKTDESQPELIWEKRYIPGSEIATTVEVDLAEGEYFWVIWCEDEFNNRGSSYNATFSIPEKSAKVN